MIGGTFIIPSRSVGFYFLADIVSNFFETQNMVVIGIVTVFCSHLPNSSLSKFHAYSLECKKGGGQGQENFKLQFMVGKLDMVVYDEKEKKGAIYEIKYSDKIVPEQYRHLCKWRYCWFYAK